MEPSDLPGGNVSADAPSPQGVLGPASPVNNDNGGASSSSTGVSPHLQLYSASPAIRRFFHWTAEESHFSPSELKDLMKEFQQSAVKKKLAVKYSQQPSNEESKERESEKKIQAPKATKNAPPTLAVPQTRGMRQSKSVDQNLDFIRTAGRSIQTFFMGGAASPPLEQHTPGAIGRSHGGVSDYVTVSVLPLNVFKSRILGLESYFQVQAAHRSPPPTDPTQLSSSSSSSAYSVGGVLSTVTSSISSVVKFVPKAVVNLGGAAVNAVVGGTGRKDDEQLHIPMLPDLQEVKSSEEAKKLFKSHSHSRLQNFMADLLFHINHGPMFSGFTLTGFLAACELLMKSSAEDRREWLFYVLRESAKKRRGIMEPEKLPKASQAADAILALRAAFGLPLPAPSAFIGARSLTPHAAAAVQSIYPPTQKTAPAATKDMYQPTNEEKEQQQQGKEEKQMASGSKEDLELLRLAAENETQMSALRGYLRNPRPVASGMSANKSSLLSESPSAMNLDSEELAVYERALVASLQATGPLLAVAVFANLMTGRPIHLPLSYQLPNGSVLYRLAYSSLHFSLPAFHQLSNLCLTVFLHSASYRIIQHFLPDFIHDAAFAHAAPPGPLRFRMDEVNKLKRLFERYSVVYFPIKKQNDKEEKDKVEQITFGDLQYQQQERELEENQKPQVRFQFGDDVARRASSTASPPRSSRPIHEAAATVLYADILDDSFDSDGTQRDERASYYLISLDGFNHFCKDVLQLTLEAPVLERAFLYLARTHLENNSGHLSERDAADTLVSFHQVLTALSIMHRGTSKERAKLLFDIFAQADGRMNRAQINEFAMFVLKTLQGEDMPFSPAELDQTVQFCCQEIQNLSIQKSRAGSASGVEQQIDERFAFSQVYGEILRWHFRIRLLKVVRSIFHATAESTSLVALPGSDKTGSESLINVPPEPEKKKSRWLDPALRKSAEDAGRLLVVCFISFAMYAVGSCIGIFASALLSHYNKTNSDLGTLGSMESIGVIFGLFISITLAKQSINGAMIFNAIIELIGAVVLIISYYSTSWPLLNIGFLIFGIGDNGFLSSLAINRIYPDNLPKAFAVYTSVNAGAIVITAVILPQIVQGSTNGLINSFFYMSALTVFSFCVACVHALLSRSKDKSPPSSNTVTRVPPKFGTEVGGVGMLQSLNTLLPFHGQWKITSLLSFAKLFISLPLSVYILLLHTYTAYGAMSVANTYGPQYFTNFYDLSLALSAFLIPGFTNLLMIPMSISFGIFFTKVGHRITSLVIAAFFMVVAFGLMYIHGANYQYIPWLTAALLSVVQSTIRSVGFPALSLLVPFHQVPEVNLIYCLFIMVSQIVNPVIASKAVSATNSLTSIWNLCVALGAFSAFFSVVILIYDWRHTGSLLQMKANRKTLSQYIRTREMKSAHNEKEDAEAKHAGLQRTQSEADLV